MSLREKTIKGTFWGGINVLVPKLLNFAAGIILARLLSASEFGIIGVLMVFVAISESFIDGGFSFALIRKKNCNEDDYSTVFIFNIFISIVFYIFLFFLSPFLADFFEEQIIETALRVFSLKIIIDAFSIVQIVKITKELNFKVQARITFFASLLGSGAGVLLAYKGFGIWSLVYNRLIFSTINTILFWRFAKWTPVWKFDKKSFDDLFNFGIKLLGSSLIGKISLHLNSFIIGKFFSIVDLGYYTRANSFKDFPSGFVNTVVSRVGFPVLSQIQDDEVKLREVSRKINIVTSYISFIIMGTLAATADNFIPLLIGDKWKASIGIFQILSFVGMLYPLQAFNLSILNVKGRSDLHIKITIIKFLISIPILILGSYLGLYYLVWGLVLIAFIKFYIDASVCGKFISYSVLNQASDIFQQSLLIILVSFGVYLLRDISSNYLYSLVLQLILSLFLHLAWSELFKNRAYHEIKNNIILIIKKNK